MPSQPDFYNYDGDPGYSDGDPFCFSDGDSPQIAEVSLLRVNTIAMEHFPSLHPGPKADFWRASEVVDEEAQITALEEKYRDELEVRVCQSFVVVARIFFCFKAQRIILYNV